MIPKVIHHVWVGPNPIPEQEKSFIDSWKKFHPSWDFFLWTNDSLKELEINDSCKRAIENLKGLHACQADIIRYVAVNQIGGFYLDTDVQCFKNTEELFGDSLEFVGLRPHGGNWITNAFFGSVKDGKALRSTISGISPAKHKTKNPYGPVYLTRNVCKSYNYLQTLEIDALRSNLCHILSPVFWGREDPYCKHLFKASWRK
jgi:mannosyltransferase OCH1-like enzyme